MFSNFPPTNIPTGNSTQAAHDYYTYLWGNYLQSIPPDRTQILWTGPLYVLLFVVILTLLFYLYTRYANHGHRQGGEMYGIMSFAGSILERIGPVTVFERVLWSIIFLWALYEAVIQVLQGYIYVLPVH